MQSPMAYYLNSYSCMCWFLKSDVKFVVGNLRQQGRIVPSMIKYQRTKNSVRNTAFGLILKVINMVGAFVTRTMLIHLLSVSMLD